MTAAPAPQKSGLGGFIKGLVFDTEPETTQAQQAQPEPPPAQAFSWARPPGAGSVSFYPPVPPATADPQIRKVLENDINEAAKPAYSEFAAATASLVAVIPDEGMRFKAALATLAPRSLTLAQVLTDIDECLVALDQKEKENAVASAKAREQRVGGREVRSAEIVKQVDQLNQQIVNLQTEHAQIQGEIATETAAITSVDERFRGTVAAYRQELQDRKIKIQTLGGR